MRKLLLGLSIVITLLLVSCSDNDMITSGGGNTPATEKSVVETSEMFEEKSDNTEQNEQSIATDATDTTAQGGEINLPKVEF